MVTLNSGFKTALSTVHLPMLFAVHSGHNTDMWQDTLTRIERRLQTLGLTAAGASRAAGLSPDAIRNLQRSAQGKAVGTSIRKGVNVRTLYALAPVLQTTAQWLLDGIGPEEADAPASNQVPICGIVTAGLSSIPADQDESVAALGFLTLPGADEVDAHRVEGDSQWPRFQHGEFVLISRRSTRPEKLIGELAMVQLEDGRRMLKTLQRGRVPGLYTLESHNAPPEHDVRVLAAWPFRGLLTG